MAFPITGVVASSQLTGGDMAEGEFEEDDRDGDSDLESRIEELESRVEEVETAQSEGARSAASVGYCVGAALATVLSWDSHHAIALATIHGLLSWLYVAYVATRWGQLKFF
jgi:predicted esterase